MPRDVQRNTQGSYDKSKFADLRQAESALHGRLQRLPRQKHTQRAKQRLTHNHGQRDDKNGNRILHYHRRINHHTHGHEENGTEQVFDRSHQLLNMLGLHSLRQYGAHDESAESGRKSCTGSQYHHAETHGQSHDKQRLVAHQFPAFLQEKRNKIYAHHKP